MFGRGLKLPRKLGRFKNKSSSSSTSSNNTTVNKTATASTNNTNKKVQYSSIKNSRHHLKALHRLALHRGALQHHSSNKSSNRKLSTGFVAPDYLEQTQELQWQDLNPGTQAPDWVPESLQPFWAAGTALGTLFSNIPEIIAQGNAGGGYHYPGMNYIGPGTPHHLNPVPVNQMDDLARIHDLQYAQLAEAGVNPYFTFNEADRYMLAHADLSTAEGWAVYLGIGMKQIFPNDYTTVEAIPPYNPRPEFEGVGEDPTGQRPEVSLAYEQKSIERGEMIKSIITTTQKLMQDVNPQTTGLPFIQALLSQRAHYHNRHQQHPHQQQQEPTPQPRESDLGAPRNPFLHLFLSGGLPSALGGPTVSAPGVNRNVAAAAALSDGLQSRSRSLRFLPPSRSLPLTSARSNVAQAASRKNMLVSSLMHKASQRDYKRPGAFTQNIDQIQNLPSGSSRDGSRVPSFVRR